MSISQKSKQSWQCTSEVISHISKYSVFPMQRINSFDFSLNGFNFGFFSESAISDSRFGCFKLVDHLLDCFPANKLFSSSVTVAIATGFSVRFPFFALMVDGCSRFKIGRILTSMTQIRLEYGNTLLYNSSPDFMHTTFSMRVAGQCYKG